MRLHRTSDPGTSSRFGRFWQHVGRVFSRGDPENASRAELTALLRSPSGTEVVACLQQTLRGIGEGDLLDAVLTSVVDAAVALTGAERGYIAVGSGSGRLEHVRGRSRSLETLPEDRGSLLRSLRDRFPPQEGARPQSGAPPRSAGAIPWGASPTASGEKTDGGASLAVPLRLPMVDARAEETQKIAGVLYVEGLEHSVRSIQYALDVLAQEAALLIRDLKKAAEVQHSLLPPAVCSGYFFTAAGGSLPCRVIGGDFFEYVDLPTGDFGFVVCDVAGKGAPAALLSAVLQGIFAGVAPSGGGPAATLSRMNHALIRRPIESKFATVLYGVLSPDGRLTFCNGGHNAPFVFTRDSVRRLDTGGPVLGLFEQARYEEASMDLEPGDFLFVFSDGVTEALNAAEEEFGEVRLCDCLSAVRGDEPTRVLDTVFGTLQEFCDGMTQTDDITALALQYSGRGSNFI
jgi:serine phosphatase RsbU (regulator of sigma subunit)